MNLRPLALSAAAVLLLAGSALAQDAAPPAAAPAAAPAEAGPVKWEKDLPAAKAAAAAKPDLRIVAVVVPSHFKSEPSTRLLAALDEKPARELLAGFVALRLEDDAAGKASTALGAGDIGHPYTALLDGGGRLLATLRGSFGSEAWAKEIRRLAGAADRLTTAERAAAADPRSPRALWDHSEALRALGRAGEADDVLARAENADPEDRAGLAPRFRWRRTEARVEDRIGVQDFEGARVLLDAYDKEFPGSPFRRRGAFLRALLRAHRGELEGARDDLRELAADAAADADLRAEAAAKADAADALLKRREAEKKP